MSNFEIVTHWFCVFLQTSLLINGALDNSVVIQWPGRSLGCPQPPIHVLQEVTVHFKVGGRQKTSPAIQVQFFITYNFDNSGCPKYVGSFYYVLTYHAGLFLHFWTEFSEQRNLLLCSMYVLAVVYVPPNVWNRSTWVIINEVISNFRTATS